MASPLEMPLFFRILTQKTQIHKWKKTVMVGAGVANINAATKLIDNGYEGKINNHRHG